MIKSKFILLGLGIIGLGLVVASIFPNLLAYILVYFNVHNLAPISSMVVVLMGLLMGLLITTYGISLVAKGYGIKPNTRKEK